MSHVAVGLTIGSRVRGVVNADGTKRLLLLLHYCLLALDHDLQVRLRVESCSSWFDNRQQG